MGQKPNAELNVGRKRVPKKGGAKVRHLGRRRAQIQRYYDSTYPLRKLRRILRCNGLDAARSWAMKNGVVGLLGKLTAAMAE